jgi:hypothetical protein
VSEAGGAFASAHDRADIDGESDEVEDLEDSIPYIEDFEEWPDAPVMLCPDPAAAQQVMGECLLHVSTFATTRVALPTGVEPG